MSIHAPVFHTYPGKISFLRGRRACIYSGSMARAGRAAGPAAMGGARRATEDLRGIANAHKLGVDVDPDLRFEWRDSIGRVTREQTVSDQQGRLVG
jgi:hypothetical protein